MYKELNSIDYINIFGCIKEEQLIKLRPTDVKFKNEISLTNSISRLKFNLNRYGCRYDEILGMYFAAQENDYSNEVLLAIDTFIEIKNNLEIDFFKKSTDKVYPSLIFFTQVKEVDGENVYKRYDIIYCAPGSESIMERLIYDNEQFENVIVIVNHGKLHEYRELNLENNIRYVAVKSLGEVLISATLKELKEKVK